jgi:outer membrane immunogenic protein
MKRFLLAIAITGLLTQGYAQLGCCDPCGPGPCAPCAPCAPPCMDSCCYGNFQGWYIGGNLGWALHERVWTDRNSAFAEDTATISVHSLVNTNSGFTVGLQTGYNWQCGCAVYGIEADANWADFHRKREFTSADVIPETLDFKDRRGWYGTIRARAGVVANELFFYGTVGAAWLAGHHHWDITTPEGLTEDFRDNRAHWGLALGTGVEWMFCSNLSFKMEALLLKFPEHTRSGTDTLLDITRTVRFDINNEIWVARVGINYNFSCIGF